MTGGGGAGTIAATNFLNTTEKYRIVLCDSDRWAAGLQFADAFYVVPLAADKRFLKAIKHIIRKEQVDIFIPLIDEEILRCYELKDTFPKLLILLPKYNFAKIALDKWLMIKEFEKHGLPCPKTYLLSENLTRNFKFPLIFKPRIGRGSRNVIKIYSRRELEAYKIISGLREDQILLQEEIPGREFTVSVVVNNMGKVLAVVPKEVIYKKGITIVAVTRECRSIQNLCLNIQKKLNPCGPFNVQLILKKNGIPKVFEINPRYSTTIALTMAAGVNEIDILAEKKAYKGPLLPFKKDLVMTRFYSQIYFQEK